MRLFSCPTFDHLPSFVFPSISLLSFLWSLVIRLKFVVFLFHFFFLVWVRYPLLVLVLLDLL